MTVKEKIESNVFVVLISTVITAVGISYGLMQFFFGQKLETVKADYDLKIGILETKLASIDRGIAEKPFLDVLSLQVEKTKRAVISTTSDYFIDDLFYASKSNDDWKYSKSTEALFFEDITHVEYPPAFKKISEEIPIHIWKGKEVFNIKDHEIMEKAYPCSIVQRIPFSRMDDIFGAGLKMFDDDSEDSEVALIDSDTLGNDENVELISNLSRTFRGDAVGTMFSSILQGQLELSLSSPKDRFYLLTTQKLGNVLYAQFLFTLGDVTVNNVFYKKFYIRRELIMISTADDLYFIVTMVPSADPSTSSRAFALVAGWLNDLKIML